MKKYRTVAEAVDSHPRVFSRPGDRDKVLYSPVFDERGHMELKEVGRENLYDFIQSHKESCDINVILARFAAGDTSVLAKRQAFYADITEFPTTYSEVINTMHQAQDYFAHLPVEVKAKFGHDFNRFIASLDDPQALADLGLISQSPETHNISLNNDEPGISTAPSVPPETTPPSVLESEVK